MITMRFSQPAWTKNSRTPFGLRVLRTPVRAPKANAYCERLIGTMRREFLDFVIPLGESHLRSLLKQWVAHYNQSRPHSSLGPGIPEPSNLLPLPCGAQIFRRTSELIKNAGQSG